jgi:hypothetical protein
MFCLLLFGMRAQGQGVVDSSAMGPAAGATREKAVDTSAESSPASAERSGVYLPVNTEVAVQLKQGADSGKVRNGEMLDASLTAPVKTSDGKTLPVGTPVGVTVLAVGKAGEMESQGELTLQVTHVGPAKALTDAQTFFGQEGHKDLPDAAPAKGTEASVATGTTLKFRVAPMS